MITLFIKYINQYHNGLGLGLNSIIFLANILILWFNTRQKFKLDKEVEKYKNELQVEFLKSQLKINRLFTIYPELFKNFKESEASLVRVEVLRKQNRSLPDFELKSAEADLIKVNNYLAFNMLFLSSAVSQSAIELKDSMAKYLNSANTFDEIAQKIDTLENQMKKELSHEISQQH